MRIWIALAAAAGAAVVLSAQRRSSSRFSAEDLPLAKTEGEKRILGVLQAASSRGDLYLNVPVSDGRMLRLLTEAAGAKSVVEIGTSTGLSGLWFSMALQKTGGKLTTFEIDSDRAAKAQRNFKDAGVDGIVTIVLGDAHKNIAQVKGPVDVVFLDADKEGYIDYFDKLLPAVRPGGLILAHNVPMVREYMDKVRANPDLETIVYSDGGGLAITLKKR